MAAWIALALIVAALATAWSRRFLASGSMLILILVLFALSLALPRLPAELALDLRAFAGDWRLPLHLLSSMFVHSGFLHLLGNVLTLLIFGILFEEHVGHRRFLAVFLVTGIVGSLVQAGTSLLSLAGAGCPLSTAQCIQETALMRGTPLLMLGASGAIFGILGAFAGARPNAIVPVPVPLLILMIFIRMRVWVGAALLGTFNLVMAFAETGGAFGGIGYAAHLGGLAAGLGMGLLWLRPRLDVTPKASVDPGKFDQFARDRPTQHALEQMRQNRDEPQVLGAWMERFFRTAKCPTCEHHVMPDGKGHVVCTHGHQFDVRHTEPLRS